MKNSLRQEKKLASYWVLVCSLYTALYGVRECKGYHHPQSDAVKRLRRVFVPISTYLKQATKDLDPKEREKFEDLSHNNVGAIAEALVLMTALNSEEIDPFCKRIEEVAKEIIDQREQ